MEGCEPQETDTHWRCYAGEGSWNWRLKFPVTLPMKPEMARLHIQLWDRDVVKVRPPSRSLRRQRCALRPLRSPQALPLVALICSGMM